MLQILGAGAALPPTEINNSLLLELGRRVHELEEIVAESGITGRRTILKQDYLRATANADVGGKSELEITPTELAVRACTEALERAGITKEEVALVIGESTTPEQTTPSESQRVAGMLGMKVNAYDITAPFSSLVQLLDIISSWRDERTPDHILFFSVNAPTRLINYSASAAGAFFGDGAGAVVLSPRRPGRLALRAIDWLPSQERGASLIMSNFGYLEMLDRLRSRLVDGDGEALRRALEVCSLPPETVRFIGSALTAKDEHRAGFPHGVSELNIWHNSGVYGHTLGSLPLVLLAQRWERLVDGEQIVIGSTAPGIGAGWAALQVG